MNKNHAKNFNAKIIEKEIEQEVKRKNLKVVDLIQKIRTPFLDKIMVFITKTGNGGTIWLITCLYLYLIEKLHNQAISLLVVISVCAIIVNFVIKDIFDRERPCDINDNVQLLIKRPMGSSLPSAHTATSFACAYVLYMINPIWGIFAYIWASLIGISRVYLYVHFLSDVLFGALAGGLIGALSFMVTRNYIPF